MLRRFSATPAALCLALLAAAWLPSDLAHAEAGAPPVRALPVAVRELAAGPQTLSLPEKVGILEAAASLPISFEVAGRVARILGEGVRVKAGDEIAQLDTELERAELKRAQLLLADAQREVARVGGLRKAQAASASQLESAVTAAELRRAELDLAKERLARRHISARFGGVVADVRVDPAEVVVPGQVVARLLNFDLLQVDVGVPAHQVGAVRPGARVRLRVPALPEQLFEGLVHVVAPAAHEDSVLFKVEILVPNPEKLLKPGMSARAGIVTRELESALSIPLEASVSRAGRRVVYFVRDGVAREFTVDEAWLHEDRLVTDAATPGHTLVVRGQHDLEDGLAVRVENAVLQGSDRDARALRPAVAGP